MFCPNLSDPVIKEKFTRLENLHPDLAYYLWDKYEGEVPAKYYNLPSTQIKPGVDEVFDENPELASVGTPQQYSAYLDSIFPDSKVVEIDNSLYISVLEDLKSNKIIEKQCL